MRGTCTQDLAYCRSQPSPATTIKLEDLITMMASAISQLKGYNSSSCEFHRGNSKGRSLSIAPKAEVIPEELPDPKYSFDKNKIILKVF